PAAEYAYNNSTHTVTGVSPFYALYGINPELVWDVGGDNPKGEAPAACERAEQMIAIRELLQEHLRTAAEAQAKYYNKSHMTKTYNVGDMILLLTKNIKLAHPSKKLDYRFAGLFRVLDLIGKQVSRLDIPKTWKRVHPVFHVSLLEPYHSRLEAGKLIVPEPVLFP